LQRLHFLAVLEERAVGIHLHLDAALRALLGELLEVLGALAFGVSTATTWTELDDDGLLRRNRAGTASNAAATRRVQCDDSSEPPSMVSAEHRDSVGGAGPGFEAA
jgi:hypothetical protein